MRARVRTLTETPRPALVPLLIAVWLSAASMVFVFAFRVATTGTAACEAILLGEKTPKAVKKAATKPAMISVATQPIAICRLHPSSQIQACCGAAARAGAGQ